MTWLGSVFVSRAPNPEMRTAGAKHSKTCARYNYQTPNSGRFQFPIQLPSSSSCHSSGVLSRLSTFPPLSVVSSSCQTIQDLCRPFSFITFKICFFGFFYDSNEKSLRLISKLLGAEIPNLFMKTRVVIFQPKLQQSQLRPTYSSPFQSDGKLLFVSNTNRNNEFIIHSGSTLSSYST